MAAVAIVVGLVAGIITILLFAGQVTRWLRRRLSGSGTQRDSAAGGVTVDLSDAPIADRLLNREIALAALHAHIRDATCNVVVLHGLYGVGKSCLAAHACRRARRRRLRSPFARRPRAVVWRSFEAKPSVAELSAGLRATIGTVAGTVETLEPGPHTSLLALLHQVRSIVVLDNLESVLSSDGRGSQELEELLTRLASTGHRSTIVITTRTRPACLDPYTGVGRPVRIVPLEGLPAQAARKLVTRVAELTGSEQDWETFLERMGRHPLALQLAALHIAEAYDGSLERYLSARAMTLDDVEELISWHLDRLSTHERDLVLRLAVHFSGVRVETLETEILDADLRAHLPEALRDLQRRMPLERTTRGFRLQPVLREYAIRALCKAAVAELRGGHARLLGSHPLLHPGRDATAQEAQWRNIVMHVAHALADPGDGSAPFSAEQLKQALIGLGQDRDDYAAGNLLNLLGATTACVRDLALERVAIRNVDFRRFRLRDCGFTRTEFHGCRFLEPATSVYALTWSADGELLICGDATGEIRMFRTEDFAPVGCMAAHPDWIRALDVRGSGLLASGGDDGSARVWERTDDPPGWRMRAELPINRWIRAVAFVRGQDALAVGTDDGWLHVVPLQSPRESVAVRAHEGTLRSVVALRRGRLVTTGDDGLVTRWDATDLGRSKTLVRLPDRVLSAATTRNERFLAVGTDTGRVDVQPRLSVRRRRTHMAGTAPVRAVAWTCGDERLVAGTDDGAVHAWDRRTGARFPTLSEAGARVTAIAGSPRRRWFAWAADDGGVHVEACDTEVSFRVMAGYSNRIWTVAPGSGGSHLYLGGEDGQIYRAERDSVLAEPSMHQHAGRIWRLQLLDQGERIVAGGEDGSVHIWNTATSTPVRRIPAHDDWLVDLDCDEGRGLVATCSNDRSLRAWDLETGAGLWEPVRSKARVSAIRFVPHAAELVAISGDELLCVSVESGALARRHRFDGRIPWRMGVDERGTKVAIGFSDGAVTVLDYPSLEPYASFSALDDWVRTLAFDASGETLLCAGGRTDACLCAYSMSRETVVWRAPVEEGRTRSVAPIPGTRTFCYAGDDATLRIRSLDGWRLLAAIPVARPYAGTSLDAVSGVAPFEQAALTRLGMHVT